MNAGKISLLFGSVFLLSSCVKTIVVGDDGSISNSPTTVVLTVSDRGDEQVSASASEPGTDEERKITSLEVWAFHAEGETDAGSLARYASFTTTETTVTLVMNGGKYDFYVVANHSVGSQPTRSAFLSAPCPYEIPAGGSRSIPSKGFPMVGALTNVVLDGAQATHYLSVLLKRRLAKFESPTAAAGLKLNLADATGLDAILPGIEYDYETPNVEFALTGFVLANGIAKSWLCNPSMRGSSWTMPAGGSYGVSTFEANGSYSSVYTGIFDFGPPSEYFLSVNGEESERPVVYAYENYPATKTMDGIVGYDRREVYAMIIRGRICQTGVPDIHATRYWRIDLMRGSTSSPLNFKIEENKVYRVRIDAIRSLGYATPQAAEEDALSLPLVLPSGQSSMAIQCRVDDWEVFSDGVIL